jgi:tetratricopeptide (TPR) repeat protein
VFDQLLADTPTDRAVRWYRAVLLLQANRPEQAAADLTALIDQALHGGRSTVSELAEYHALRARARFALDRKADALADARTPLQLQPTLGHERLWFRLLLAQRSRRALSDLLALDELAEVDALPALDRTRSADIRASAEQLARRTVRLEDAPALRTRALLLAALGEPAAEVEANRAMVLAPASADSALVRAQVLWRLGDVRSALEGVNEGLALNPGSARLLEFRGRLLIALGRPLEALLDLDRALLRGARGSVHAARAEALLRLGKPDEARLAWTQALAYDPENPGAWLGRASAFIRLRKWDSAVADLEKAGEHASGHPGTLARTALLYAACLPARRDRWPRVIGLLRQTVGGWMASASSAGAPG